MQIFADQTNLKWVQRNLFDGNLVRDFSNPPGPWFDKYVVVVHTVGRLRQVLPLFSAEGRAKEVVIVVESFDGSRPLPPFGVSGPSVELHIEILDGAPSATVFRILSREWLDVHKILAALARQNRPSLPLQGIRLGISDSLGASWAAGDPQARWVPDISANFASQPVDAMDVVLDVTPESIDGSYQLQTPTGTIIISDLLQPIDPFTASPRGFEVFPQFGEIVLLASTGGQKWSLQSLDGYILDTWDTRTLAFSEACIGKLRNYTLVHLRGLKDLSDRVAAQFLSQLAAAGIPMKLGRLNSRTEGFLGAAVVQALSVFATCEWSPSARESASVDLRRQALRSFLPSSLGRHIRTGIGLPVPTAPTISVLLATKRPELVGQALAQIDAQTHPSIETVLVLHGIDPSHQLVTQAVAAFGRELRVVAASSSETFGSVLNRGLAQASGAFVAKMDDDDWYGPHHLEDLVLAREYSDATLIGVPVEFTYLSGPDITTRRSHSGECFATHVAGGSIFISKHDLESLGGWRNTRSAVDRGLIDAVLATSGTVYRTHGQNYLMHRRSESDQEYLHTWKADDSIFLQDIREQWNGFYPPPQFAMTTLPANDSREQRYRSWFSE